MTVWHDQPSPLSRRQARELARGELARDEIARGEIADRDEALDASALEQPTSALEQPTPPATRREAASGGRRVQWSPAAHGSGEPEPLIYATQGKIPSTDPVVESRPIPPTEQQAESPVPASDAPTSDGPTDADDASKEDRPAFRLRDYRPDGRRSTFGSLGSRAQTGNWTPPPAPTDDLEYRTHGGPGSDSGSLLPPQYPRAVTTPASDPEATNEPRSTSEPERRSADYSIPPASDLMAPEHTMTRRELRALRERAEAASQSAEAAVEPAVRVEPVADVAGIVEEKPAVAVGETQVLPELVEPEGAAPQTVEPEVIEAELVVEPDPAPTPTSQPERLTAFDALFTPGDRATPAAEPGTVTEALVRDASPATAQPVAASQDDASEEPSKPFGHWSTQAAIDDASQLSEAALRRDVGATTGAITTHALVLPSIPESGDQLLSPLTSTGEIMVTGSIDLPRSFGSTGAHPALFDHSDVDALIDESDREDASSESAPVRAIRAVSSNTSTRGVIEAPAPQKSRLPLILGIVFGGVLLVAAGVVIAGLIFNAI